MRKLSLFAAMTLLGLSVTALADVKLKTKQTMSGQTSEVTTYIKGKRQRIEMGGGTLISLTQCDLGRDLQLNPQTRTYVINLYEDGTQSEPVEVKAGSPAPVTKGGTIYVTTTLKDTGERKQMFGLTARRIIQTMETEATPDACATTKTKMEMDMWVVDAEFGLNCGNDRQYRGYKSSTGGCRDKYVPKTIGSAKSGYPLWQKMTSFDATGKETYSMIQEVVEFSRATLDAALFEAPADYRQVKDSAEMYASTMSSTASTSDMSYSGANSPSSISSISGNSTGASSSGTSSIVRSSSSTSDSSASVGVKKPGTVRVGVVVKTTAVGEGITANDLAAAVQNTLGQYLKGTKVEVVALEAKLAAAQASEAKEKECDFVMNASVAHKKGGGGGFGFGKILGQAVAQSGVLGSTGSVAGNIAGHVASSAIISATSVAGNVKAKDELTLDVKLQSAADNSTKLAKQFKAKAKGDGDDIISAVIEQAAQAIIDGIGA